MRKVLIVTSSYAPTMIADMQRARQLAWELPELGWEVTVLSPSTEYQPPACIDQDSSGFFAPNSRVTQAPEFSRRLFRIAGIGNIGWRALWPVWIAGRRLLRENHFDLVYFSTAQIPLFLLGRLWQRQFGVPYVLDLHDPLSREQTGHPVWMKSRFKYRISRGISRFLEANVTGAAAGLVAVSPHYIDALRRRYGTAGKPWARPGCAAAIPFSALDVDLRAATAGMAEQPRKEGPPYRIVYVGAGGPVMMKSFTVFCHVLSQFRTRFRDQCEGLRVELFGTVLGWKPGDPRTLAEIAQRYAIDDMIWEDPGRVSYRRSLELLLQSDGTLVFGVDDPAYMPSKLFTYAISGKPLLASLHREGPAFALFQRFPDLGHAIWFKQDCDIPLEAAIREIQAFLHEVVCRRSCDRGGHIEPFLSPAMACRHRELFEACL